MSTVVSWFSQYSVPASVPEVYLHLDIGRYTEIYHIVLMPSSYSVLYLQYLTIPQSPAMSYTQLTAVPKLVVNEKDVRTDENVKYIASLDERRVRRARCDALLGYTAFLLFFLVHLNPIAIPIICCLMVYSAYSYSKIMKRWELYVTEKSLCHVNPLESQGMDFFTIPLAHIASVNTQRMSQFCYKTEGLVITLKQMAPPIAIKNGRRLTRTFFIKFVEDADDVRDVLRQWIEVEV